MHAETVWGYNATNTEAETEEVISPEKAFSVLGDGLRLQISRTLGEAGGSLAFSELYEGVEHDDTGNFDYAYFTCFWDSSTSIESARR